MKNSVFFLLSGAVLAAGLAFGGPKAWIGGESGDWNVPTNWDPVGIPDSSDDVMVVGADVTLTGPIDVNALTVTGAAKLTVKAVGLEGEELAVFSTLETDLAPIAAKLWEKATIVNVRNDFTVKDGATVYPEADKVSGVPVIFKVGGDFTLGEGSSFNAVNRGWGWTLGTTELAGAKTNPGGTAAWTFAPGAGRAYNYGGGYGGNASCPNVNGGRNYGYSYGCSFAPFLPGSCSGVYTQTSAATVDGTRGGGVIVIFTEGEATIDGTMTAMSERHDYSSASGGSIWLTAKSFTFGTSARLTAKADNSTNYQWQGVGGGGRIALAEGYTWVDMATAAGGTVPTGFIEQPTIWPEIVDADVSKAACNDAKKNYEPNPGTLSYVRKADLPVQMRVTIDGAGSVTYDGTTYDESFVVDVPVNEALTLTAAAADGNVFGAWYGDGLAGGVTEPELSCTASLPFKWRVVFKSLTATTRAWAGAVSADWNTGANWNPAGVPGPNDSVTLGGASLMLDATVDLAAMTLADGAALTVGAVSISVGGADARNDATLNISGDLTVSGGSKLTVYANELADYSVFATLESDLGPITNALWNAAKIVTVGGDLTVTGTGSTVYPDAGYITGVPVFFKVGGDFTLGEGASFNAVERGWGWTLGATPPISAAKVNGGGGAAAWNLAPGAGYGYTRGGGYGGNAAVVQTQGGHKNGYAYGSDVAPFLPGSCGGLYSQTGTAYLPLTRGGGAIVVFAAGKATVDGTMNVSSVYHDHAGASGGAIYLAAQEFAFGADAALTAKGGNTAGYSGVGMGGGGRIALAEGYTWADFVAAASGIVPEGFRAEVEFPSGLVTTDVSGGDFTGGTTATPTQPGTLAYICSASQPVELSVTINGNGSVSYDGETYSESFTILVPTAQDLTFTAVAGGGARFISWGGACIPGMFSEEAELHLTLDAISSVSVTFADGDFARVWCGGATGAWEVPMNWQPAGLPKAGDKVIISNATVSTSGPVSVGNLTLAGSAVLENAAVPLVEPYEQADIFNRPTVITVNGALRVEDTAKIVPSNDPKTGAAVRYDVGSLYVAEGASFNANGKGWYWYESKDDPYATVTQDKYQTRAPGAGGGDTAATAYNRGGGYGANGGNSNDKYGRAYGFKYAPYLPGSPNGVHSWAIGNANYPGGTIWIRCAGLAEINGTLSADGLLTYFGAPSGGAVWLAAKGLAAGVNAKISAQGGELTGGYTSYGAGGRVSVALGLTDAQLAALCTDEPIDGLTYEDEVTAIAVDVRSGVRHAPEGDLRGNPGTATTVTGPLAYQRVTVASSGKQAKGVAPTYGNYSYEGGTVQTFTAPEYGIDPDDPSVRYLCTGWELVNAEGEKTSGDGRTAEVTVEHGPLTLTWKWGAAQSRTVIRKPANGTLTFDGVAVDGDGIIWATGLSPAIAVVPDSGYEFVGWEGNVPYGKTWANPLQVTVTEPLDLIPVVRAVAGPTTRTWNGTGDWTDAAKWDPAGLPGAGDAVVIAGGKCVVSNGLRAAALTVADGATLAIAAAGAPNGALAVAGNVSVAGTLTVGYGVVATGSGDNFKMVGTRMPSHVRVAVGGDFTLTGSGRVEVYGGPVGGDFTFASGCGFVEVGGTLALQDTSVLALYSDIYTGGSVKITAGGFTVAEGATVDAASKGYAWANSSTPPDAPGLGYSYTIAASHGGWGCQPTGQSTSKVRVPYDFELAPTMPGSPNGTYAGGQRPGGGVIRVHAKTVSIDGTLDAGVFHYTYYGGAAGGSIWLTADAFAFGANARLIVNGGRAKAQYATYGAGGRIAIGYRIGDARLAALAETGTWPGFKAKRQKTPEEFRATIGNATMTVDVEMGGYVDANPSDGERAIYERMLGEGYPRGTFTFVNDYNPRTLLFVK